MAEPIGTLVVNGGAGALLLVLGFALLALSPGRAAKLLGGYLAATGSLFVWAHVARWTTDPADARAAYAASRALFYYAWLLLALFASAQTRIHVGLWRRGTITFAACIPTAFLLLDFATPAGAAFPFPYFSFSLFLLTCAFVYAVALFALALRRERTPSAVPVLALLLAAFAGVGAVSLVELLSSAERWRFLSITIGRVPPVLPHTLALIVPLAAALPLLLAPSFARAPAAVRGPALAALAIAAFVAPMSVLAMAPTAEEGDAGNVRWLVFAILVGYAALRHGYLGSRPIVTPFVEYPLAAAGFGALFATFLVALQIHLPPGLAIGLAFGLALLVGALLVGLSQAPLGRLAYGARYAEHREIARSPHGRVVLARDRKLHRDVVLHPLPPGERALADARIAARVKHPALVAVHDVVEDPGGTLLVLEHVPGDTLEERLRTGPLATDAALAVGADLRDGLAALHAAGLVHGALDARHVVLRPDGHAALSGLPAPQGEGRPDASDDLEALDALLRRCGDAKLQAADPGSAACD